MFRLNYDNIKNYIYIYVLGKQVFIVAIVDNETVKLYYDDSYMIKFKGRIIECTEQKDVYKAVLDTTCFYPEGGGQPADKGTLGEANVLDVQEKNGVIYHTIDRKLNVGEYVEGIIDWEHRFELMQHHSGEHIVSGIVHKLYGYNNVGFRMGSNCVTVDFNGKLSEAEIKNVEIIANKAIYENIEITTVYPSSEELGNMEYRSKKALEGNVRIAIVPKYDVCACCGTHVMKTGEIGIIKFISSQSYKGGTRLGLLCGRSALENYDNVLKSALSISSLLSANYENIVNAVENMKHEKEQLNQKNIDLQMQIFELKSDKIGKENKNVYLFEDNLLPNDLKRFCTVLCRRIEGVSIVLSGNDNEGYKYAAGSINVDCREFGKEFNATFSGRGGGAKEIIQGSIVGCRNDIEEYLNRDFICGGE